MQPFYMHSHYYSKRYMKKQIFENMKIPQVEMHQHKMQLRRSLLTSSYWDKKQKVTFLFWKGGEKKMHNKRFLGITLSAFVMVLALAFIFIPKHTETAYAEQVAQKSIQAVAGLSPDKLQDLKEQIKQDSKQILEDAKNAKDLTYFTYDQYVQAHPDFANAPMPPKLDGGNLPDIKKAQFLEFTDTDGAKVSIAIDPDSNLPFFITKQLRNGDHTYGKPETGAGKAMNRYDGGEYPSSPSSQPDTARISPGAQGSEDVMFQINTDGGSPIFEVNGKKYELPEGIQLDRATPPDIKVEGNDVYVNGQKAKPIE